MCYFQTQCADVKYKLFQAYCTSLYGCELWNLLSNDLVALCTAWRKGVRRVWGIPPDTHCYILPLLCKRLPVYDEICRCSANFVRTCLLHNRLYECCSKSCKLWCFVGEMWIFHGSECFALYASLQRWTVWLPLFGNLLWRIYLPDAFTLTDIENIIMYLCRVD